MDEEVARGGKKDAGHQIGEALDAISIEELKERIVLLRAEIQRLEKAIERKNQSKSEADSVFKF